MSSRWDDLYQYNKEQELELDSNVQHCHNCLYWSEPNEVQLEPNDLGECVNMKSKKTFGKRPKNRWCMNWLQRRDY